nr:unnamed protein product [Digitaria exilis]
MKGRAVKLREAHKSSSPALCSAAWGPGGQHVVTASAADTAVLIHDAAALLAGGRGSGLAPLTMIRLHKDGVTALAIAPGAGGSLASGSIDHSVKFFTFPEGKFQSNVARFTLPIRSLAFNKKGTLLAAAGDDDGIKLIATIDNTISKVLKGHKGSVTGLAFDPKNDYLASVDSFGTVMYWDLCIGGEARTLSRVAPTFRSDNSVRNMLCWSPDGQTLAVPGLRNNVVLYDRDTGEEVSTLKGDHEQPVCSLCWSPNGRYLATAGLDRQVLVWDVKSRQDIERQKFDERICSLAWKPDGNSLLLIDVMGRKSTFDGYSEDEDLIHQLDSSKRMKDKHKDKKKDTEKANNDSATSGRLVTARMQAAFQPGSTLPQFGMRNFLAYNMLGSITTIENEGHSHVEVDFHDTGRGPRVPSMTDYFGFTMAALNESGSVFANPCKGDKNMSTLMYRPFDSWAGNSEMHILSVSGPVVTAAGHGDQLAIVSHASDCLPSGDQVLDVKVMPKPVLTIFELSFPIASSDLGANSLENEFMMRKLHLSQIQNKMDEMAALGLDTTAYEDEAFNMEAGLDRCILRLISSCCSGDKLVRATELAKLLTLEKSMKGALTLVTRLKLPMLQEKFSSILEERMLNDRKVAGAVGFCSNATIKRLTTYETPPSKLVQNGNNLLGSPSPIPKPGNHESSLTEPKKPEAEQARGNNTLKASPSPAFTPLAKVSKNSETKRDKIGASNATVVDQNKKGGMDQNGARKMSTEDCNRTELQRPVNPFAKSSSSKEQSPSLLDSIKKMNVETEKVEKPNSKKVKV